MFIGADVLERTKVELKYCESCGALWLRKQGGTEANCSACQAMWIDLPGTWIERLWRKPEANVRNMRSPMRHKTSGVAQEGGRA